MCLDRAVAVCEQGLAGVWEREYVQLVLIYTMHLNATVILFAPLPTAFESRRVSQHDCVPDSDMQNFVQGCAFMYV